jgi:hypothetical protein
LYYQDGHYRESHTQPSDGCDPLQQPPLFRRDFVRACQHVYRVRGNCLAIERSLRLLRVDLITRVSHQHERCLKPVIDFEFVENVSQVCFDRLFADKNFFADFLVG